MPRSKRNLSPQSLNAKKRRRTAVTPEPDKEDIVIASSPPPSDHEQPKSNWNEASSDVEFIDEDFDVILAKIDELEGRKPGNKKRANGNHASGSGSGSHIVHHVDQSVIGLDSNVGAMQPETDEALAKRLAAQWDAEDRDAGMDVDQVEVGPSIPTVVLQKRSLSPKEQKSAPTSKPTPNPELKIPHIALYNPEDKLQELKILLTSDRNCSKCNKLVHPPRGHVMFTSQSHILPPSVTALLHALCTSCKTNHCRGCFTPVKCPPTCRGPAKKASCTVANCCAEGRAIALFEVLGGFDRQYLAEKATAESRAQANLANKKAVSSVGPGGTGYSTGSHSHSHDSDSIHYSGRGCGRGRGGSSRLAGSSKTNQNQELANHWEAITTRALNTITYLLPAPYVEAPEIYDMLPHPSIGPLFLMSHISVVLSSLLRNDSVTDWIARSETYHAILALLRRMADCELTIQVLIGHRQEFASSCGLENWMWDEGEIRWRVDNDGKKELAPPLLEYFTKLAKQSEAFLTGATQMMNGGGEDGGEEDKAFVEGASLCGDIIAAKGDLERAMKIIGTLSASEETAVDHNPTNAKPENIHRTRSTTTTNGRREGISKGKGKTKASQIEVSAFDIEKEYTAACERLSFEHVPLFGEGGDEDNVVSGKGKSKDTGPTIRYANFNFSQMLSTTQNATRQPKDRLHLVKELAVMATSLPPGIWVRVDETRNDAIKILIAGPQGTPYAGGLFEFDCFMPLQYPNTPPLVHLRTTGKGTVRFNPNLYNCGKVCLSLLGTWAGAPEEQWSSKSTLLQVLVSIQSMILNEVPYYNEPGHGKANAKSTSSINYNREVSFQTVRWAMVDWLKEENRNGIWKDVIKSHFTIQKNKIRQQIVDWSASDPRIRSFNVASTVNEYRPSYDQIQSIHPTLIPNGPGSSGFMSFTPEYHFDNSNWNHTGTTKTTPGYKKSLAKQHDHTPAPPKLAALPQGETIDLLKKFDDGMLAVEGWGTEEA